MLDGFYVRGFGAALLGSLIYSVFGIVIDSAIERLFLQFHWLQSITTRFARCKKIIGLSDWLRQET